MKGVKGFQKGNKAGGRKKANHTISAENARAYVINRVIKELEPILTGQIESAKGIWMEDKDKDGKRIRVYQKAPNLSTAEYLENQVIGKATETMKVTEDIVLKLDI